MYRVVVLGSRGRWCFENYIRCIRVVFVMISVDSKIEVFREIFCGINKRSRDDFFFLLYNIYFYRLLKF